MKRIKRKQLKEDEFVTTFTRVVGFIKKRIKLILAGAAAVLVLILIFLGIRLIQAQKTKQESARLGRILSIEQGLETDSPNLEELEKLEGTGKYGRLASLKLAVYWYEHDEFSKAKDYLESIPSKTKDLVYYQAQDLLGQIHMKQQNWDQAIEIYQKIEQDDPESYSLDMVLFRKAQALENKGERELALALFKKIEEDYPQTYFGYDAAQKVKDLEEKK